MNVIKKTLIDMYLDYINNFLTVEGFAENYEMTIAQARKTLVLGREFHTEEIELQLHLK